MSAVRPVDSPAKMPSADERRCVRATRLVVWGMVCPNCATRIHGCLAALAGVVEVQVDHNVGMAYVTYDVTLITVPALIDAVQRAGSDRWHTYGATESDVPYSGLRRHTQRR
ncbi:MAG TPA: heavy-metal-associated domain-containing protein [Anaerolineae bacterium]|nr:heavy-metal-associated domain-containing protein [Anaerolineae bacterium]